MPRDSSSIMDTGEVEERKRSSVNVETFNGDVSAEEKDYEADLQNSDQTDGELLICRFFPVFSSTESICF